MSNSDSSRKKPNRAPEYLAAGAALELAKLEETIANAEKKLKEKRTERTTLLESLSPEIKAMVDRLRGTVAK